MSSGFEYDCDLQQGFNFKPDVNMKVMLVKSMTIGETELKADFGKIRTPTDSGNTIEVVGIGTGFCWDGRQTGCISLDFNVSATNKQQLAVLTKQKMGKTNVDVEFAIYAFDDAADQKAWYECFYTNETAFKGAIHKSGDYAIHIDEHQDMCVAIPANYRFSITIDPDQSAQQDFQVAFGVGANQSFPWGIEQVAG